MVAPTDFNLQSLHGRTFEGFVQFQIPDGSVWYRLKERQTMTFNMKFDRSKHYADDGTLAVDPAGISHTFSMSLKITSDMFDSVWPPTDKKTLSYWIYKNMTFAPIEVIFVTSFKLLNGPAGDTSRNSVNIKFVLNPDSFTPSLGATGGAPEITVGGIVMSITNATRSTTTDQ